ncbi:hypothetical protein ACIQOU_13185 [Streptomyces sp. NPDC091279]|uniref:hypothetical protein n=1 Tax=unclassified Streptomyces TaxID=2593676 RepID=UPI0037F77E21
MSRHPRNQQPPPDQAAMATEFLAGQEITHTECRQCGSSISGVNGRYACGHCGWVNHWSEGHTSLPAEDEDA